MASQTTYLAVIVCLYSLSEFVLSRAFRKRATAGSVVRSQGTTLLVVCCGSLGFLSLNLAAGLGAAFATRSLLDILLLRQKESAGLLRFANVQVVTLVLLAAAWYAAIPHGVHGWYAEWEGRLPGGLGKVILPRDSAQVLLTVAAYCFMVEGGSRIVRGVLYRFPLLMQRVSSASVTVALITGTLIRLSYRAGPPPPVQRTSRRRTISHRYIPYAAGWKRCP